MGLGLGVAQLYKGHWDWGQLCKGVRGARDGEVSEQSWRWRRKVLDSLSKMQPAQSRGVWRDVEQVPLCPVPCPGQLHPPLCQPHPEHRRLRKSANIVCIKTPVRFINQSSCLRLASKGSVRGSTPLQGAQAPRHVPRAHTRWARTCGY